MATRKKPPKRFHPPPVPGLGEAPRLKAQHARAFDAVIAKRPLAPPGQKVKS